MSNGCGSNSTSSSGRRNRSAERTRSTASPPAAGLGRWSCPRSCGNLEKLYPEWRAENPGTNRDEFKPERDAANRLLARLEYLAEVNHRLGGEDRSPRITASSLHPLIWKAARPNGRWASGMKLSLLRRRLSTRNCRRRLPAAISRNRTSSNRHSVRNHLRLGSPGSDSTASQTRRRATPCGAE